MNIRQHIPNALTCGNLLCGCLAIVSAFNGNLVTSAYFVGIAAVLDFFDGFVARLLKVGGELGKQLDSLADMVTFGVVPGIVMYHLIKHAFMFYGMRNMLSFAGFAPDTSAFSHDVLLWKLLPYIAFLIPVFSALRLAKFNIDTRQTTSFIGVPTPANAILICSFPLILNLNGLGGAPDLFSIGIEFEQFAFGGSPAFDSPVFQIIMSPYFLISLTVIMSFLLVAELPLFALKFKNFSWNDNKIRFVFLIISVLLLILFQFIAIPFIIFLYIILSIINNLINRTQKNEIQS